MVCLGFKPTAAGEEGWKAQTNPPSQIKLRHIKGRKDIVFTVSEE